MNRTFRTGILLNHNYHNHPSKSQCFSYKIAIMDTVKIFLTCFVFIFLRIAANVLLTIDTSNFLVLRTSSYVGKNTNFKLSNSYGAQRTNEVLEE